jgi:hypothetical protein
MPDREIRVRPEGAREAAAVVGNPAVAAPAGAQALHAVAR